MTVREAKTILENMQLAALSDTMIGREEKHYEALGVAIEAIDHWITNGRFPTSTQYIKRREKSIAGAERIAEYKDKGEAILKTYIYDAGFADGYMSKNPRQKIKKEELFSNDKEKK